MKKVLLMGLFFAIIFLILAGLVLLARKKKTSVPARVTNMCRTL